MTPEIVKWIKIVVLRTLKEKHLTRLDTSVLISAGMLGYSQALKRFDPGRNVKFKTFAEYRIKGAVLDEVRKMIGDERAKTRRPHRVDDFDFATNMTDHGDSGRMIESNIDIQRFACLIALSPRELDILRCRIEGKSIREIASEFDFSESRANQLLAKIKKTVYAYYRSEGPMQFGLATYLCPVCQSENITSDKATEFRCDVCDSRLVLTDGTPIAKSDEQEQEEYDQELR